MRTAVVLAALVVVASCGTSAPRTLRPTPPADAPVLPALSYRLRGGGTWSSIDARGKIVVIDVWATYCKPCKKAFPKLDRIHALGSEVVLIGISVDEDDAVVETFLRETPASFAIGRDPEETVKLPPLSLTQLPTVLVLDRQGRVRYRGHPADESQYDALRAIVVTLLAE